MPTAARIRPRVAAALSRRPCRPLAFTGRTGAGTTSLLRAVVAKGDLQAAWCPAVDLVERVIEALRCDRFAALRASLVADPRPLVIEHLEDLRGKPRTRDEIRRLLLSRAANGAATILTLTTGPGGAEIVRWLGGWAEVVSLDRARTRSARPRWMPPRL
jgi:chromosomal replication initiation ATPase DnaA